MSVHDRRTQKRFGGWTGLAAVLVAGLLVVFAAAVLLAGPQLLARTLPPTPVVAENVSAQAVAAQKATERGQLDSYGWVDKETGLAHIPVAEAIQQMAEAGLPVGAPKTIAAPTGAETAALPVGEVSFSSDVLPIFVERCSECHGDDDPEEGLEVTSYRTLMLGSIYGSVIKPGDVAGSYLFDQVNSGKMPKKGDRLTPTQIEIIRRWIEAGAQDN
ncbi:MAG: hypothetical protein KF753_01915 [Caldilineaceae bacterium]|nr:hypothetical protein [Caldilineaceae bacterium]